MKSVIFSKNQTQKRAPVIHAADQNAPQNHTVAIISYWLRNRIISKRRKWPILSALSLWKPFKPDYPFLKRLKTKRKAVFSVGPMLWNFFAHSSAKRIDSISFWWSTTAEECHCGCTNCLSCPGNFASCLIQISVFAFESVSITETPHKYMEWRSLAHLFWESICLLTWIEGRNILRSLSVTPWWYAKKPPNQGGFFKSWSAYARISRIKYTTTPATAARNDTPRPT